MRMSLTALLLALTGCLQADLVLYNGKVVTMEEGAAQASTVVVTDGRIVAVGGNALAHKYHAARRIDLQGRLTIPGFIESHAHFTGVGQAVQQLDLTRARNWDEIVAMAADAARSAAPGEWILGRGWHQEKWDRPLTESVAGFPTHSALSAVTPHNPVWFVHASGHACLANERALVAAGIGDTTPDPAGGEILRDESGRATGVLIEEAEFLVGRAHSSSMEHDPQRIRQRIRQTIQLADRECISKGVTTFHDAGSPFRTIDVMREMAEAGELDVRLWVMVRAPNNQVAEKMAEYRMVGAGDNHLTVRAIKRGMDGALGSRGAWLLAPYSDAPHTHGLNTEGVEDIAETARLARAHNVQLCVHAIGDRANREVLDIFESTFPDHRTLARQRWRIEHAQHLDPEDVPRFSRLGVIAAMQAVHCTSDAPFVTTRLGSQRADEGAYLWRTLLDSGTVVCNGTDAPVEDVDPIACFYSTVTRKLEDGSTFHAEERLTRMEALASYTRAGAYAGFEEDIKGTLTVGKLADIVVLSRDILTCREEHIREARVDYTIVGGRVVFERSRR